VVLTAPPGRGVPAADAGPGRFASAASWEHLARAAAAAYGVYVVLANRVGVEGGAVFGGGSLIVAPGGDVLARGDDLAADRPTAELSLDAVASARRPYAHARDDDPHLVLRELRHLLGESG
jgi:N-carbamoylputrescine amidase